MKGGGGHFVYVNVVRTASRPKGEGVGTPPECFLIGTRKILHSGGIRLYKSLTCGEVFLEEMFKIRNHMGKTY